MTINPCLLARIAAADIAFMQGVKFVPREAHQQIQRGLHSVLDVILRRVIVVIWKTRLSLPGGCRSSLFARVGRRRKDVARSGSTAL